MYDARHGTEARVGMTEVKGDITWRWPSLYLCVVQHGHAAVVVGDVWDLGRGVLAAAHEQLSAAVHLLHLRCGAIHDLVTLGLDISQGTVGEI
jgi:hypothetical protein